MSLRATTITTALAALSAVLVSACGGSSSRVAAKSVAATAAATSAPQPPVAGVRILRPHNGVHTGSTLVVRVRLVGDRPGRQALLYRLDRRPAQRAGERLVLRHLNPGRHRLLITIAGGAHGGAAVTFVVRRPAPPAPASASTAIAPAPTTTASAPTTTSSAPTTTAAPAPTTTPAAPAPTPPSPPATAIPQHNGGDQDADNNGGPTDGDGNI